LWKLGDLWMSYVKEILALLREKEYKLTPQRKIIIQAFFDNMEKHLSAEDVFNIVSQDHPEIGLATVYRTLDLLAELGILKKMNFGDNKFRYEFCPEKDNHHHHHLICLNCNKVIEFEDDLLESLEALIAKRIGFHVVDHQLKVFGFCKNCKENLQDI